MKTKQPYRTKSRTLLSRWGKPLEGALRSLTVPSRDYLRKLHHEVLQRVRRGLGLDFLAFDYSLDQGGELVVWEINVLPGLGIPTGPNRDHLVPPIERAMAATLKLYLQRAGLEVPARVEELLVLNPRCVAACGTAGRAADGPRDRAGCREVASA